ncbi:MAG: TonB family protein [Terriglobales bacterium]
MSYKALLFCPDEKAARTVTQVLTELDFQVEPCNEPFAAVKRLTTEHFDGVVVDCDNEQNAALLFKSARNSASNQASLAVAVVEGQSGVAKAFRIGANLVLTKPINVEQSKGTLRVARGLLRKNEAAKATGATPPNTGNQVESRPAPATEKPPVATVSAHVPSPLPAPSASISSLFEVEEEPEAKPGPADAALLESMSDQVGSRPRNSDPASALTGPRQNTWQPASKPMAGPMAAALKRAAEAAGKTDFQASNPAETAPKSTPGVQGGSAVSASFAAAAPAPAREAAPAEEDVMPSLALETSAVPAGRGSSAGSNRTGLIAAIVLLAVAGGYFGWTKYHASLGSLPFLKQAASPQIKPPAPPAVAPSQSATAIDTATKPSAEVNATPLPSVPDKNSVPEETVASTAKKPVLISVPSATEAPEPVKTVADASDAIVVTTETPKPVAQKPVSQETPDPAAPPLDVASDSSDKAISGLVDTHAAVPHAAPQTLRVSQGVSQGLLVKKVPPAYPPQAVQMHIQGSVQLLASIAKDGNISAVKLISGDPILGAAAMDAVKQWKYKPYYLNGQPMEIQTQITVNFSLP